MNNTIIELCPICIENQAEYYTECGHAYCINCLCRIKKCAMCRHSLQRAEICIQIRKKAVKPIHSKPIHSIDYISEDGSIRVRMGPHDVIPEVRMYIRVELPSLNRH